MAWVVLGRVSYTSINIEFGIHFAPWEFRSCVELEGNMLALANTYKFRVGITKEWKTYSRSRASHTVEVMPNPSLPTTW